MSKFSRSTVFLVRVSIILMLTLLAYVLLVFPIPSTQDRPTITVYAYSDMLSPEVFEDFEEETGIHVNVRYFEAAEELITRLVFSKDEAVDVVMPTDGISELLIREDLLLPLDRSKISSYGDVDTRLLGQFYDHDNVYTIPFSWSPIGIGYDSRVLPLDPNEVGWDLVFGRYFKGYSIPPHEVYNVAPFTVCMGEDPWESLYLASIDLFGDVYSLTTHAQRRDIVTMMRNQRTWLESYTNNLKYFLVAGISPCVVIPAAYMVEIMREYEWARFAVPKKGSLMILGDVAIPRRTKHPERAYKLIEYLLSEQGSLNCHEEHLFNPVNVNAYKRLDNDIQMNDFILPKERAIESHFFLAHNKFSTRIIEHMWHIIKL